MTNQNLDKEEMELMASIERGEWSSVPDLEAEKARLREAAQNTMRKDKRVNIRISARDLEAIQVKALEHGIPYQTLMSSILHRFVNGSLKDA